MEVQRLKTRGLEILKITNNVNPNYMKNVFTPKTDAKVRPDDILVKSHKPTNYGDNLLLRNIKPETCFSKFNDSHRKNCVLFNSVQELLLGCFWPFSYVYTINYILYIPLSRIESTDVGKIRFIKQTVKMNGCFFQQVLRPNFVWFLS